MSDCQYKELKIDKIFKNLIPLLSADEYKQLEENLINEGCRDPICVWNEIIIDGHNRYEICLKHKLPFQIKHIFLQNKTEAITWICANQIGRRNISDETRRYLIGKRYESEKILGNHNIQGKNQHFNQNEVRPKVLGEPVPETNNSKTARRIGAEYHLSHATIEKYGAYTRAIDTLVKKNQELVPKILSGRTKISHDNVVELSKLSTQEVKRLSKQLIENDRNFIGYAETRKEIDCYPEISKVKNQPLMEVTVKDMPVFDPDADISSLVLTIPSWISSMERTLFIVDLNLVSDRAKNSFIKMLNNLKNSADNILINLQGRCE